MPPKKENNNNNNSNSTSNSNAIVVASNGLQNNSNNAAVTTATTTATTITSPTATAAAAASNTSTSAAEQAAEQRQQLYLANAKLCRLVRKCPWMYDRNHQNYAKKQILDKSWLKIAKDCDDSMASCKERWRNIRAAFARSINIYKTHGGPNRVKPYYLHNELRFLVKPMLDGQKDKANLIEFESLVKADDKDDDMKQDDDEENDEEAVEEEEEEEEKFETENDEDVLSAPRADFEDNTTMEHKLQRAANENGDEDEADISNLERRVSADLTASDVEADFNFTEELTQSQPHHQHQQRTAQRRTYDTMAPGFSPPHELDAKRPKLRHSLALASSSNADARFLETLLPDMRMMNARQKVIFKRKIYQSLEEVFETNTDFPNCVASLPHPLQNCSAAAQTVAQSVASLNDSDLYELREFMRNNLRHSVAAAPTLPVAGAAATSRLQNGGGGGVVSSTPTQVGIIPGTNTTITRTMQRHQAAAAMTTSPTTRRAAAAAAAAAAIAAATLSPWDQHVPIAVKEEIDDVDVD